jgi:hypothetical protein
MSRCHAHRSRQFGVGAVGARCRVLHNVDHVRGLGPAVGAVATAARLPVDQIQGAGTAGRVQIPGSAALLRFATDRLEPRRQDSSDPVAHVSAKTTLDTYSQLFPDSDDSRRAAISAVMATRAVTLREVLRTRGVIRESPCPQRARGYTS